MKYEYKFEKVDLKSGLIEAKPKQEYHDIIDQHAQDGWRFVQIFAPSTISYGRASYFELIFERATV